VLRRATNLSVAYYYARDFASATQEAQRALTISPGNPVAYYALGRIESALTRQDRAIDYLQAALQTNRSSAYLVELARVYAVAGMTTQKQAVLTELAAREKAGEMFALDRLAYMAVAEGRIDDAFRILDEAVDRRLTNVLWIAVDPRVDPLRHDPRFNRLLSKAGLDR
jgi:tetratricopeptide (TPR) repeat protein